MNMSEESILPHSDEIPSPFSVNALEIVFAIAVALATIFGLWSFLHSALPYPCGFSVGDVVIPCGWTEEEAWQQLGLPLFLKGSNTPPLCGVIVLPHESHHPKKP